MKSMGALHPDFTEGWVGVDGAAKLASGEFRADRGGGFGDEFGGVRSHCGRAQELIRGGIGNPFDESHGFPGGEGFSQTTKTKLADFNRAICFFRVILAEPDRADFGRSENDIWNEGWMRLRILAERIFSRGQPLGGSVVGKLNFAGDIPNRKNRWNFRSATGICLDESSLACFQTGAVQREAFRDGSAAHRAEEQITRQELVAKLALDRF